MSDMAVDFERDAVVTRVERTAGRTLGDRAIVVVIDRNELHTLNRTGTLLWNACEGKTIRDLCELLQSRYDLEEERALADVRVFLRQLSRAGAIQVRRA